MRSEVVKNDTQEDIDFILDAAQRKFLESTAVLSLLESGVKGDLETVPLVQTRPASGAMFLYDRNKVESFRVDGHSWIKKKGNQVATREDHVKLKVLGEVRIYACHVHSAEKKTFHRRCYWDLRNKQSGLVLVHYLDTAVPNMTHGATCICLGCRWKSRSVSNQPEPTLPLPGPVTALGLNNIELLADGDEAFSEFLEDIDFTDDTLLPPADRVNPACLIVEDFVPDKVEVEGGTKMMIILTQRSGLPVSPGSLDPALRVSVRFGGANAVQATVTSHGVVRCRAPPMPFGSTVPFTVFVGGHRCGAAAGLNATIKYVHHMQPQLYPAHQQHLQQQQQRGRAGPVVGGQVNSQAPQGAALKHGGGQRGPMPRPVAHPSSQHHQMAYMGPHGGFQSPQFLGAPRGPPVMTNGVAQGPPAYAIPGPRGVVPFAANAPLQFPAGPRIPGRGMPIPPPPASAGQSVPLAGGGSLASPPTGDRGRQFESVSRLGGSRASSPPRSSSSPVPAPRRLLKRKWNKNIGSASPSGGRVDASQLAADSIDDRDVDALNEDELTELSESLLERVVRVLVELTREESDLVDEMDALDESGFNLLHYTVAFTHERLVALLLDQGADPNKPTSTGDTPLHLAAEAGDFAIAQRLVAAGADAAVLDPEGLSCSDLARKYHFHDLADWFAAQAPAATSLLLGPNGRPLSYSSMSSGASVTSSQGGSSAHNSSMGRRSAGAVGDAEMLPLADMEIAMQLSEDAAGSPGLPSLPPTPNDDLAGRRPSMGDSPAKESREDKHNKMLRKALASMSLKDRCALSLGMGTSSSRDAKQAEVHGQDGLAVAGHASVLAGPPGQQANGPRGGGGPGAQRRAEDEDYATGNSGVKRIVSENEKALEPVISAMHDEERSELEAEARVIQANFRKWMLRRNVMAARRVQTETSGFLATKEVESKAIKVQAVGKGFLARKEYKQARQGVIQVQAATRCLLARKNFQSWRRHLSASLVIQRSVRAHQMRLKGGPSSSGASRVASQAVARPGFGESSAPGSLPQSQSQPLRQEQSLEQHGHQQHLRQQQQQQHEHQQYPRDLVKVELSDGSFHGHSQHVPGNAQRELLAPVPGNAQRELLAPPFHYQDPAGQGPSEPASDSGRIKFRKSMHN